MNAFFEDLTFCLSFYVKLADGKYREYDGHAIPGL